MSLNTTEAILKPLLIVEDDEVFRTRLSKAMHRRGYAVEAASSVVDALMAIDDHAPDYAIVDLRLRDGSGLDVVLALRERNPATRAIVLTGYGNHESAVSAVRSGAIDVIAKPTTAEDIDVALNTPTGSKTPPPEHAVDPNQVRMVHIYEVYEHCDGNISETARQLGMHRRTLQRILRKAGLVATPLVSGILGTHERRAPAD